MYPAAAATINAGVSPTYVANEGFQGGITRAAAGDYVLTLETPYAADEINIQVTCAEVAVSAACNGTVLGGTSALTTIRVTMQGPSTLVDADFYIAVTAYDPN